MSGALDPSLRGLDHCGCCAGVSASTPASVSNRDGLDAIAYRVGTHAEFKRSLLAALSDSQRPELRPLHTRRDDDFTIALLDGWATVADVLAFYQERYANESYLRTATERRSILELARAIGYELDPGVAASTSLALTVEPTIEKVRIPKGVKVQSVPGQDEKPQTFETIEEIKEARPEWNELRAASRQLWNPQAGDKAGWLQGLTTALQPGDTLLLVRTSTSLPNYWLWDAPVLIAVATDAAANCTQVSWRDGLAWKQGGAAWPTSQQAAIQATLLAAPCQVFALRKKATLFGANAVAWRSLSDDARKNYLGHPADDWEKVEWPGYEIYAPQRSSADQPPRVQVLHPTPEEVAQAARDAARNTAKAAEKELAPAVTSTVGAAGAALQQAGKDATAAMKAVYDPPGLALKKVVDAFLGILGQFTIKFPDLAGLNFGNALNPMGLGFNPGALLTIPPGNPIVINSQPDLPGAFGTLLNGFKNVGFNLGNIGNWPADIADGITQLIKENPAFFPFNALKNFGEVLTANPNDTTLPQRTRDLAKDLGNAIANVLGAVVTASATKIASEAVNATMKMAVEPHNPLPPATPESVALIARVTVKVGKYAALIAALPSAPTTLLNSLWPQRASLYHAHADPLVALETIHRQIDGLANQLRVAAGSSPIAAEFDAPDAEDKIALALVLSCLAFGVAAVGTAALLAPILLAGAAILAPLALQVPALFAVLTITAATDVVLVGAVLLMAPGVFPAMLQVAVAAAMFAALAATMAAAGVLIPIGPPLLRAAKRSETAVLAAVKIALQSRNVPRPPRLLPARDYHSINLDAPYPAAVTGGWVVLSDHGHKMLFQVEENEEVVRSEFQQSLRVSQLKLRGAGLAGPFRFEAEDIRTLERQGLLAGGAIALHGLASHEWEGAQDLLNAIAAVNVPSVSPAEVARQLAPHLRDLLVLSNRNSFARSIRSASVHLESSALQRAARPITSAVFGLTIDLDRAVTALPAARKLIVRGKVAAPATDAGQWKTEAVLLDAFTPVSAEQSRLELVEPGLSVAYDPATVSVYANIAAATHGESVTEILGSGDASRAFQRFALKHAPLTYTRANSTRGVKSSIRIWVNDIKWTEVPSLFERAADERIFITRRSDDGMVTVIFGDGRSGARLPTGTGNIRATYRKGTGVEGMVRAGQLKTLLSRPLGLRDAVNRLPALGADDPEKAEDARINAPLTVRTLDRVVSLQDYEDFARAYPGIAKALATWTWTGRVRGVLLTVALVSPPGDEAVLTREFAQRLHASLHLAGDPFVPVRIAPYRPAFFEIAGTLRVKAEFDAEKVLAAARDALRREFGFAAREFGQPVAMSALLATLHRVPGIESVDLDHLQRTDRLEAEDPAPRLAADLPVGGVNSTVPTAELLLILEDSLLNLTLAP